jgi:hypothetical protein
MFSVRMTRGYRRESACVFVKGAWQPGVQSERVWTTWFRRLVCTERFVFRARTGPLCPTVSSKMQLCGHRKKAEEVIGTVSVRVLDVFATKLHISHEPCVRRHRFCMTTKSPTLSDNQAETCLIITINDTSIGDLPLMITISDTCKNQPKRLDSDNTINLSSLIASLVCHYERFFAVSHIHDERFFVRRPRTCEKDGPHTEVCDDFHTCDGKCRSFVNTVCQNRWYQEDLSYPGEKWEMVNLEDTHTTQCRVIHTA